MYRARVLRTSSFRLALMYATLTGVTFIILLGVIYLSTARFMRHQIDDSVGNEIDEILSDSKSQDLESLAPTVDALSKHASGFYYLLQDSAGRAVAGTLPPVEPVPGVREWEKSKIRGRGLATPGGYLFVGWSTHQLLEMEEM